MNNNKIEESNFPGFRNYEEFLQGYRVFSDFFRDGLKTAGDNNCIANEKSQSDEEMEKELIPIAKALIKGASALQFVGKKDFYFKNENLEVLIRYKKDYSVFKKNDRPYNMIKDIILLLEQENNQTSRISLAYDIID